MFYCSEDTETTFVLAIMNCNNILGKEQFLPNSIFLANLFDFFIYKVAMGFMVLFVCLFCFKSK